MARSEDAEEKVEGGILDGDALGIADDAVVAVAKSLAAGVASQAQNHHRQN